MLRIIMTIALAVTTTLCQEARLEFNEARKYGATHFRCKEYYDGRVVSSFRMPVEKYRRWKKIKKED